ncbi:hypothetical protein [Nocardia arthritidis]|uniref:hypothetical protein n=1 Tax=Nocardia arthritidis TaxID=228602 RepID=UPI00142DEAE0|nr:hypothetical protein [Nocardia arthritidis]
MPTAEFIDELNRLSSDLMRQGDDSLGIAMHTKSLLLHGVSDDGNSWDRYLDSQSRAVLTGACVESRVIGSEILGRYVDYFVGIGFFGK